jgi:endonuclease I
MRPPSSGARRRGRPPLALALALLAAAACGDEGRSFTDGLGPDLGLPVSGRFGGALISSATDSVRFVAGRGGETTVRVCGPAGTDFDLLAAADSAISPSNCERIVFAAEPGRTYRFAVRATSGAGPYRGCWSGAFVDCGVDAPQLGVYWEDAEGLTGAALLAALNDIIDEQTVLGYTFARESLYAHVEDPDDDDVIEDVYVGREAPNVRDIASAAAASLNTEHSWPQSRGANEDPANSDLHILFAADADANGQRSNHPFGDVTGAVLWESPAVPGETERSRLGFDAQGRTVFEPRASRKGDIARALLYFYVRYAADPADRTPSFSLQNFDVEEATLIEWAQQDPPDDFELARHERIFRAQGNRNPFVDRPDFLTAIGDFPDQ